MKLKRRELLTLVESLVSESVKEALKLKFVTSIDQKYIAKPDVLVHRDAASAPGVRVNPDDNPEDISVNIHVVNDSRLDQEINLPHNTLDSNLNVEIGSSSELGQRISNSKLNGHYTVIIFCNYPFSSEISGQIGTSMGFQEKTSKTFSSFSNQIKILHGLDTRFDRDGPRFPISTYTSKLVKQHGSDPNAVAFNIDYEQPDAIGPLDIKIKLSESDVKRRGALIMPFPVAGVVVISSDSEDEVWYENYLSKNTDI